MLDNIRRRLGSAPKAAPEAEPDGSGVPRHIGIIMDGNGRWATQRGLPRVAGHRAGVEALRRTVRACKELGIPVLTVYAFSTENWARPKEEVDTLMRLIVEFCRSETRELAKNGVRVNVIGRISELPGLQQQAIREAMEATAANTGLLLNVACNYGGRAELADACKAVLAEVQAGKLAPEAITPEVIEQHLYTAGIPDPDLIIRFGGDLRLSNFLLWQAAYAEIWVTPLYWPDFSKELLQEALADFRRRERRFGAIKQTKSR